ncbi:hypothetical protein [Synechococcus sp. Cu2B8-bc1011]|uniref:hypothetical protein n=1 Tax=Synechococcus sp. Cu2B8-bc1011 TaxID=3093725 RepID=UPI0039B0FB8A
MGNTRGGVRRHSDSWFWPGEDCSGMDLGALNHFNRSFDWEVLFAITAVTGYDPSSDL